MKEFITDDDGLQSCNKPSLICKSDIQISNSSNIRISTLLVQTKSKAPHSLPIPPQTNNQKA